MKDTFTQFIRLGLVILTLGLVLYWVECTWFAPSRIVCEQDALDAEGKHHICWHTLMQQYAPEKIIWIDARSEADYEKIARYIAENPARWQEDCFYEP